MPPNGNGHQNLIAQPATGCPIEFRLIHVNPANTANAQITLREVEAAGPAADHFRVGAEPQDREALGFDEYRSIHSRVLKTLGTST